MCRFGSSRETVRSATSMPSFNSSPWIRGAPHKGFAAAMRETRARISALTGGRPTRGRPESLVQCSRKRCRCHRRTVSGVTITRDCRHPAQTLASQILRLDQEIAELLRPYQDPVQRLAEVPGLGVDSAQQILAEVGPTAATFPSAGQLASWVGACPGEHESAQVSYGHRSPKGHRQMRRLLNQAANAAVKANGTLFELLYRR